MASVAVAPGQSRANSMGKYARIAGVMMLISIVGGGFGEMYVGSSLTVATDAAATAHNIVTHLALYRAGFAAYLMEAICDVSLTWFFYVLLRPVSRDLALLAAFMRLMATATFAFAELFYFAPVLILRGDGYLKTFSPDQLNSLALLCFKLYGNGGTLFMVFYGIGLIVVGTLIYRCDFLPGFLGVLGVLSGAGFVIKNFLHILAPAYASDLLLLPTFVTMLAMAGWFLVKGIDVQRWKEA